MGLRSGLRRASVLSTAPLVVRVDGDPAQVRSSAEVDMASISAGSRCLVANLGGGLTVVSVADLLVPCAVEAGRSPGGAAPPSDSVRMTAGTFTAAHSGGAHIVSIDSAIFSVAIIAAQVTPWTATTDRTASLRSLSRTAIEVLIFDGGTLVTADAKLSYTAIGW